MVVISFTKSLIIGIIFDEGTKYKEHRKPIYSREIGSIGRYTRRLPTGEEAGIEDKNPASKFFIELESVFMAVEEFVLQQRIRINKEVILLLYPIYVSSHIKSVADDSELYEMVDGVIRSLKYGLHECDFFSVDSDLELCSLCGRAFTHSQ